MADEDRHRRRLQRRLKEEELAMLRGGALPSVSPDALNPTAQTKGGPEQLPCSGSVHVVL